MTGTHPVSPMRSGRVRHASDVVRVGVGVLILALASLPVRPDRVGRSETGAFDLFNGITDLIYAPVWVVMQLGAFAAVPVLAVVAFALKRRRLALDLSVVGTASWLLAKVIKDAFGRPRPGGLLETVAVRGHEATGMGFASGHTAVAVGLATAAAPHVPRRYRWILWVLAITVGLSRIYVGAHLPLDVVGGAGLGFAVGALFRLAIGTPTGRPEPDRVEIALERAGLDVARIEAAQVPAHVSAPYHAVLEDGREVFIKLVSEEIPDRDLIYRFWRWVTRRQSKHEQRFRSPRSQVDHEAVIALAARQAGVRTPEVIASKGLDGGTGVLAFAWVEGQSFEATASVSRDDLLAFWREVAALHEARIAHGSLVPANVILGADGPSLVDFGYGEMAADDVILNEDVIEALVSLSVRFGTDDVVATAIEALGGDTIEAALDCGSNARWSPSTTADLADRPDAVEIVTRTAREHLDGHARAPQAGQA